QGKTQGIALRHFQRRGARLHAHHARRTPLVLQGERDVAATGAQVDHAREFALERKLDHELRLGPRNDHRRVPGEPAPEEVELADHDAVDLVERQVDAMVGDAALWKVVRADALGAVTRADEALSRRGGFRLLLALALVTDARRQHAERLLAVLMLRARILALD